VTIKTSEPKTKKSIFFRKMDFLKSTAELSLFELFYGRFVGYRGDLWLVLQLNSAGVLLAGTPTTAENVSHVIQNCK
jgi:hypothetical protein